MAKKDKKYGEKRESRKEEKRNRKAQKKAGRKEKYAQLSLAEKIGRFAMKICLSILVIVVIVSCGIVALTYFDVIEVPAVSYFLDRSGIVHQTKVDTDPMIHNYIPEEDSIAVDEETNLFYANDEILVIFSKDATEEQKNKVITFLNGELAGSVPEINLYQIKISSCDTLKSLEEIADTVMEEFDYVIYATYDTAVSNPEATYVPNDPWDGDVDKEDWENNTVDGSNWWIEAIEAQRAWDYKDKFSSINVGICDSSFDVGHEDLKNKVSFPNDVLRSRNIVTPWWLDFENLIHLKNWSVEKQENFHGTHVAGIIGAEGDNKKGITGIVQNCEMLLAPLYYVENMEAYLAWDSSIYANLSTLVKSGAKVVNFSQGKTNFLEEKTNHLSYDEKTLTREGNLAAIAIAQLIDSGYKDFIIVQSAGNGTGDTGRALDAKQNGWFASITDNNITGNNNISIQEVRSHVIIVGAVKRTDWGYEYTSFSNFGDQVNVCAPGSDIYSTIPGEIFYDFQFWGGYGLASGTSMSAPIVTGVSALVWSVKPDLSAEQVKNIVCGNSNVTIRSKNEKDKSYPMVNAKLAVEAALKYKTESSDTKQTDTPEEAGTFNGMTSGERNIVLVLDTSGSMSGDPMMQTRKAAKNFASTILKEDASIGVVTYSEDAEKISDFSSDETHLTHTVEDIGSDGGTNMEAGLAEAKAMLDNSNAKKKIIVLMSDGEPNEGKQGEELINYAEQIKNDGILVYTLGFFESMEGSKSAAQYLMEKIASDGCHYEVANADDLVFFFGDVADQINGQKYIYIRIACPVEVSVTYKGESLNSAEEDQTVRTDFGTLTFEDNEDSSYEQENDRIKVLRLKEGADYDVQIVGTDRGKMNYTIGFMDENGDYSDFRYFDDIRVTQRTVIDTVATVSKESILKIDEDGDGKYEKKLRAKENGYGEEVKRSIWVYIAAGAGVVVSVAFCIVIVLDQRKHEKRRGKIPLK